MIFNSTDISDMDEKFIDRLTLEESHQLIRILVAQAKEQMDRLNQNSRNSSKPPSQDPPWSKSKNPLKEGAHESSEEAKRANENKSTKSRKPGKQPGSQGYGRTIEVPVTDTKHHAPCQCAACGTPFDDNTPRLAINGHYTLDIVTSSELLGLAVTHVKHIYYQITCDCGQTTSALPTSAQDEEDWSIKITEWHLCGPMLIALIVCLSKRYHLSRNKIQEFLEDWLGIHLSKGVINKSLLEAGRSAEPLEEKLIDDIKRSDMIHIDETSWKEFSNKRWLWVFATNTVCLFLIGARTKAIAQKILDVFSGTVMSDGYNAYRHFKDRLRCWAHLERKLNGLFESRDKTAQAFGLKGLDVFERLKKAIKAAREGPDIAISAQYADLLTQFKVTCREYSECSHPKTQALAKEFLNDWEAIWRVLSDVHLPMTNNEAERLLRHWVINRQISFGTRNHQGSRALSLLASVIETCRLRKVSPWKYLAEVITARRKNLPVPPLPVATPL